MHKLSLIFDGSAECEAHDVAALRFAASRLASFLQLAYDEAEASPGANIDSYCIPMSTLSLLQARTLGLTNESQFWGGMAPHAFVATKLISHPLWSSDAVRPEGWLPVDGVEALVLPGYSVFSREDAWASGRHLLQSGEVRIKLPFARGGNGQAVVRTTDALGCWLATLSEVSITTGLVLERNLVESVTCSVGSSSLPGHDIAYQGSQRTIKDPDGNTVYGGSSLRVRRGTLQMLSEAVSETTVSIAMAYDRLLRGRYAVLASRRNYDVIIGVDSNGNKHTGVLEQSWRFGGASMAELLAFEWLQQNPQCTEVDAETVESYEGLPAPSTAVVYADGGSGSPQKYARVLPGGH